MYHISTGVPQGPSTIYNIFINDLCNASKLFKMIIYDTDDTALYSTLDVFGNNTSKKSKFRINKSCRLVN